MEDLLVGQVAETLEIRGAYLRLEGAGVAPFGILQPRVDEGIDEPRRLRPQGDDFVEERPAAVPALGLAEVLE